MKKIFGIIVLGLLLSGCATNGNFGGLGTINSNIPVEEAQKKADALCNSSSSDGKLKATKVTLAYENAYWHYSCETTLSNE